MNEPKTKRGQQRRAALLETATELFLSHGYDGTSLDMVIERAGGSRRTVYERFGNKEGLFAATVEAMLDRLLEGLSSLDWEHGTPEEVLTKAGSALVRALTAPDAVALFRMVIAEAPRFPHLGAAMYRKGPSRAHLQVATYLREQADAGRLELEDPELAGRQLVEMMKGDLHMRALLDPERCPQEAEIVRHTAHAVHTFLRGVRPRTSSD